jgi:hypothetical protein
MAEPQQLSFYMHVYISQAPSGVFAMSEGEVREPEPEIEEWGPEEAQPSPTDQNRVAAQERRTAGVETRDFAYRMWHPHHWR